MSATDQELDSMTLKEVCLLKLREKGYTDRQMKVICNSDKLLPAPGTKAAESMGLGIKKGAKR